MAYTVASRATAAWKRGPRSTYDDTIYDNPDVPGRLFKNGWLQGYEQGYIEAQRRCGEKPIAEGAGASFVTMPDDWQEPTP